MSSVMALSQQKNTSNRGRVPNIPLKFSSSVDGPATRMDAASDDEPVPERMGAFHRASLQSPKIIQITDHAAANLGRQFKSAFAVASKAVDDIKPVFLDAANGLKRVAAEWHDKTPIGIPGAKFHAMIGQIENSHVVRMARQNGRDFRDRFRPAYYAIFAKINSLQM